jgi:hypothetical protein
MRNLEFANGSPQSIKLGDSSNTLSLLVTELDQAVDLSKASSITVKNREHSRISNGNRCSCFRFNTPNRREN